jgi:hypothetical protein
MNRAQMHVTIGSNRQGGTDGIITVAFFTSAGQAIEISMQGWNGATES